MQNIEGIATNVVGDDEVILGRHFFPDVISGRLSPSSNAPRYTVNRLDDIGNDVCQPRWGTLSKVLAQVLEIVQGRGQIDYSHSLCG